MFLRSAHGRVPVLRRFQDPAAARSPLIGRARELAAVRALVPDADVPIVTLICQGAAGKTRPHVAADLPPQFNHGVCHAEPARAHARDDHARTAVLFSQSLTVGGDPPTAHYCLRALGALAAAVGMAELAARLSGAFGAPHEMQGIVFPAHEQWRLDEKITSARQRPSGADLAEARPAGRAHSVEVAVAEVMDIAASMVVGVQPAAPLDPATGPGPVGNVGLTTRERKVVRLLAEGRSNRGIAAALSSCTRTVDGHVAHLLGKLRVGSRTGAAPLPSGTDLPDVAPLE